MVDGTVIDILLVENLDAYNSEEMKFVRMEEMKTLPRDASTAKNERHAIILRVHHVSWPGLMSTT
jgi:hypothetical protein